MTTRELAAWLGRTGTARVQTEGGGPEPVRIPVQIIDARLAFGRVDLLCAPRDGVGAWWINANNVETEGV